VVAVHGDEGNMRGFSQPEGRASWVPLLAIAFADVLLTFNVITLKLSVDAIVSSYDAPASTVKTAIIVYSLVVSALILPAARLGKVIGSRRVFRVTLALFGAAMTLMALSPDALTMMTAQVLAGAATAALLPTLTALIVDNYEGAQRTRAMGWLGTAQAVSIVPGVLLAGAMATWLRWRFTFGVLVVLAAGVFLLSERLRPAAGRSVGARIDVVGLALAATAIFLIGSGCTNLTYWGVLRAAPQAPFNVFNLSPAPLAMVGGLIFIKIFLLWSHRYQAVGGSPLIALETFSTLHGRSALFSMFMIGVLSSAITFVLPLYIEIVQGRSSLYAAAAVVPFAAASFGGGLFVVRARNRTRQSRLARLAFMAVACGLALLAVTIHNDWSDLLVIAALIIAGAGEGALATLLFYLLVKDRGETAEENVAPLCGTTSYLAFGVGTALASALVIGVLGTTIQRQLLENPLIPPELKLQVNLENVSFISNDELRSRLSRVSAKPAQVTEAVRINTEAQRPDRIATPRHPAGERGAHRNEDGRHERRGEHHADRHEVARQH
jgi:MFS family permease